MADQNWFDMRTPAELPTFSVGDRVKFEHRGKDPLNLDGVTGRVIMETDAVDGAAGYVVETDTGRQVHTNARTLVPEQSV